MKITILICLTAILITVIHDVAAPLLLLAARLDAIQEISRLEKNQTKPSLEIIPEPQFRAKPDLRKENL